MAAELFTNPSRSLDANADPYAGALAYFYATGTTTPQSVYTSAALSTPHANPVVADSGGKFATIYMDATLSYRCVIKNSTGAVTLHDIDPVNPGLLGVLAASGGSALIGFLQAGAGAVTRTAQSKMRDTVSILDFMAAPDGTTDNTTAFQAAVDSLTNGGTILVPKTASNYRVSQVNITNDYVTVELEPGATIKKHGNGGAAVRGVFQVANLLNAHFTLRGGTIDLNGEGPKGIGTAGRIANTYDSFNPISFPNLEGIAGPANAAVFGLRASHITVEDTIIKNSGESGVLFRNCGDTLVERVDFSNIANYGVDYSLVTAVSDQGTGTMPDRSRCHVRDCSFTDINDYGLGTGNGCGVGGGGGASLGAFYNYSVTGCSFLRCYRGVHLEFQAGSYIDGFELSGFDMREIGQNGLGLIGVHRANIDGTMHNVGQAPAAALTWYIGATYPDVCGAVFSSVFDHVKAKLTITDDRAGGVVSRGDGVATAADATFTSAGATFASGDVGKVIGILGAGPSGIVHETTIASRTSNTEIELTVAPVTSVAVARFAYGGACREGVIAYTGTSIDLEGSTIEAGTASGLASEPNAAAVRLDTISGYARLASTTLSAPSNGGTTPVGLRVVSSTNVAFEGGQFTGTFTDPVSLDGASTKVRIAAVGAGTLDHSWGNLTRYTFALLNIPTGATTALLADGYTGIDVSLLPCAGRVVATSIRMSAAGTGNFTFKVLVAGVEQTGVAITQADFGGGAQATKKISAPTALQGASGAQLTGTITTDGTWVNTVDALVHVFVDHGMKL